MLLGHFQIRYGTPDDVKRCQQIARQHRDMLPFVMLPTLQERAAKHELFVAVLDGEIVGFVSWHARRDGWQTIYDLAVDHNAQGLGVGRALLYAVPAPVRLKCTVDNELGNKFYAGAGMRLAATESAESGRALNVWEMRILPILCAGNNTRFPEVARRSGMAYGTRHDMVPRDWPFMLDINWKVYDWQDYMQKVNEWKPVQAMCADYEHASQKAQLEQQIRDLEAAGVLRVKVCPKFAGAVADIPNQCVIAVSVPTSYAGFVPDFAELKGRRVHLLGGSPVQWFGQVSKRHDRSATGLISAMVGAGVKVISVDGNSHTKTAIRGGLYEHGKWAFEDGQRKRHFDYYELCITSGRNIVEKLNDEQPTQLSMF